jgi:single-stranded-DNA-specific exonuclease
MEIKNLEEVAKRILEAIEKKERILIYGDADLDGVCSVIILRDAIRNLGGVRGIRNF